MKKAFILVAVLLVLAFSANNVFATNITIYDGASDGTAWHGTQEDNEVEPGCVVGQQWDLEAFLLEGSNLTMVGGFDFLNGESGYSSGDIFVDVASNTSGSNFNGHTYEYAIDLDFATDDYNVYELGSNSVIENVSIEPHNAGSDPWQYNPTVIPAPAFSDSLTYADNLTVDQTGFLGDTHYTVELLNLDPTLIAAGNTFHFTMGCGNDNLMGQVPVPEPSTLLLLGMGFLGFVAFKRKKYA